MVIQNAGFALLLALFAGLSTGIGSALAFFTKKTNVRFLAVSLGFSAGVMIYVSFAEMMLKSIETLSGIYGTKTGGWIAAGAFFSGMALLAVIDKLVPSYENPHEARRVEDMAPKAGGKLKNTSKSRLMRMGFFSALAIAIHNFPEGLATFAAALKDPALGLGVAIAIAIHNIPEGIAVSVPLYYATGSRKKAFFLSFLSGLAEPAGALIGWLVLTSIFNETVFGIVFSFIAGIMVFISLDQLLPGAEEYGEHHLAIYGLLSGMAVMAVSLLLFT